VLTRINEELLVWGRTYLKVYGANLAPAADLDDGAKGVKRIIITVTGGVAEEQADVDPYADREDAEDIWDDVTPAHAAESEVVAK
jgi:hypothetical protein